MLNVNVTFLQRSVQPKSLRLFVSAGVSAASHSGAVPPVEKAPSQNINEFNTMN